MPLNVWMSEGAVQLSLVTLGFAASTAYRSHRYVQRSLRSDDPYDWGWVSRWRHVHRINTAWLCCTVLLLAFQIRMHLFQTGAMPFK